MSEQEAEEKESPEKIYPTPLKRFILTVIGLFIFVVLFGQIVPRLLFEKKDDTTTNVEKTIEKPEEGITSKKPVNPVIIPDIKQTINPEIVSETTASAADDSEKIFKEPIIDNPIEHSTPPAIIPEPESKPASSVNAEHMRTLEEKIISLETTHESAISELQKKLATQNSEAQNKADSIISSLIIFGQLKDAVNAGRAYANELTQLKKIANDNTDITKAISLIEADANTGIITPEKLKSRFSPLIKQALTNKDESALSKILHRFITIRKVGEQSGSSDEAILARAEITLAQGDFAAVLSELEQLSEAAKEIFSGWQQDASKMLDTQKTISNLQLLLTQTNQAAQP